MHMHVYVSECGGQSLTSGGVIHWTWELISLIRMADQWLFQDLPISISLLSEFGHDTDHPHMGCDSLVAVTLLTEAYTLPLKEVLKIVSLFSPPYLFFFPEMLMTVLYL